MLKKYKCHKVVHATYMCKKECYDLIGRKLRMDENPNEEGYFVVYSKDTDNHYESWSPKEQFEEGYTEIEDELKHLQPEALAYS